MEPHPLNLQVGKVIARLRKDKGWTQDQLAEKAKLAKNTVQKIETAQSGLTANNIELISGALGVHPSELFLTDGGAVRAAAAAKLASLSDGDLDWLMRLIKVLEEKVGPSKEG